MKACIENNSIYFFPKIILLATLSFSLSFLNAQRDKIDSLKRAIALVQEDTQKISLYEDLGQVFRDEKNIDSGIIAYKQALELNENKSYSLSRQRWELACINYMLYVTGNYIESLKYAAQELVVTEKMNDQFHVGYIHLVFGHNYKGLGEYRESLNEYFKAKQIFTLHRPTAKEPEVITYTLLCISEVYLKMNEPDSALLFTQQAYKLAVADSTVRRGNSIQTNYVLYSTRILGDIYLMKGDDQKALDYYRKYIYGFIAYDENNRDLGFAFNNISRIFQKRNQPDSAIVYAKKAFYNAQQYKDQENIFNAAILLSDYYKENDEHTSFAYFRIATQARDSMISSEKLKQAQVLFYNEQLREKEKQEANAKEAARKRLIIIITSTLVLIATFLVWNRLRQLRIKYKMVLEQKEVEKLKTKHEKDLLELEAKALRAQMNPHFIFNCLNSIKSLIQQKNEDKAIGYLTTFSKLIRTIFQNSDKREITLFDEIETCRLYTQLESMRFGNKFSYTFNIDETIDLKSIQVPALIIQPFIENAIWHGIIPNEDGGTVSVTVGKKENIICCIIDDDGIGREMSKQNKFKTEPSTHQSKGVHLTQSRLNLDNALNQRNASVEIIDKKDAERRSAGTKIILSFKEY